MKTPRILTNIGRGSATLLTILAILAGLITGSFLIYTGLQYDNAMRALLCGTGAILILYSLSLMAP